MNKYVSFVSDEDFLECVEYVIGGYLSENKDKSVLGFLTESENTIDEVKTLFDVCVNQIGFEEWTKLEIVRQNDKTINNKIGEFHQKLLGKVDGWVDLGVGDETEIDLKKEDNSVFIELKNKYNTMNSSSSKTCREKLENVIVKYPDATAYWAYIVNKNYKSEDRVWKYHDIDDERIRRISGDKLYEMITGNPHALEEVFEAIPKAVADLLNYDYTLQPGDEKIMKEYKQFIFHDLE